MEQLICTTAYSLLVLGSSMKVPSEDLSVPARSLDAESFFFLSVI